VLATLTGHFNITVPLMRFSPVGAVPCSAPILFLHYRPIPIAAPRIIIADFSSALPNPIPVPIPIPAAAVRYPLRAKPHHLIDDDKRDIAEQARVLIQSSQRRRMPLAEDEEPVRPPDKLRISH
jgi:hypothetical protein